jgi:hypothetical protein
MKLDYFCSSHVAAGLPRHLSRVTPLLHGGAA